MPLTSKRERSLQFHSEVLHTRELFELREAGFRHLPCRVKMARVQNWSAFPQGRGVCYLSWGCLYSNSDQSSLHHLPTVKDAEHFLICYVWLFSINVLTKKTACPSNILYPRGHNYCIGGLEDLHFVAPLLSSSTSTSTWSKDLPDGSLRVTNK